MSGAISRSTGSSAASSAAAQITPPPTRASSRLSGPDREREQDRDEQEEGDRQEERRRWSSSAELAQHDRAEAVQSAISIAPRQLDRQVRRDQRDPAGARGDRRSTLPAFATDAASRPLAGSSSSHTPAPLATTRAMPAAAALPGREQPHRHLGQRARAPRPPARLRRAPGRAVDRRPEAQRARQRQLGIERGGLRQQGRRRARDRPGKRREQPGGDRAPGSICPRRWALSPAPPRRAPDRSSSPRTASARRARTPRRRSASAALTRPHPPARACRRRTGRNDAPPRGPRHG